MANFDVWTDRKAAWASWLVLSLMTAVAQVSLKRMSERRERDILRPARRML